MIYNESWGQLRGPPYPEGKLTEVVRNIDPSRLIDSVTGWNDHGFGDFSVDIHLPRTFFTAHTNHFFRTTIIMPIPNAARHSTRLHHRPMIPKESGSKVNSAA